MFPLEFEMTAAILKLWLHAELITKRPRLIDMAFEVVKTLLTVLVDVALLLMGRGDAPVGTVEGAPTR